jgi:NADH:ubiquinone oxidoreductase subunit 3 (subunit A)
MAHSDIVVFFLIYLQPLIIGFFMVCALRQGLSTAPYFSWLVGARRHRKNARFFECAARPRLLSLFTYELPFLAFCALFILYDADLLFFLPEIVAGEF